MEDKCRYDLDETVKYYDEHAQKFIDLTIHADVSKLYRIFEKRITSGGGGESLIFDAGVAETVNIL